MRRSGGVFAGGLRGCRRILQDWVATPAPLCSKTAEYVLDDFGPISAHFTSGGLSSIASGGQLSLNGAGAQVQIAGNSANNNSLNGPSSNAGFFYLRNGAAVTTTTGLNNSNSLFLDIFGNDGGASPGVDGTLTNSGTVHIGSSNDTLSANTTVTANAVNNTGTINLYGNGTKQAALKVSGAAGIEHAFG
jgi:hypothetical protein